MCYRLQCSHLSYHYAQEAVKSRRPRVRILGSRLPTANLFRNSIAVFCVFLLRTVVVDTRGAEVRSRFPTNSFDFYPFTSPSYFFDSRTSNLLMADPKLIRELTIKTNVVKRLVKESESYVKEAEKEREKIKKMEQEDPDNYNIKKAREQHQETLQMVPLVAQKLQIAREALREFIEKNADAVAGTPELSMAEEHLTASEQVKA
ncbi:Tubulin-specific chaperone A [Aphelenchoides besseyi]|nr:Tubulin-specific chaperone A [Aphelenchoides besseyi]